MTPNVPQVRQVLISQALAWLAANRYTITGPDEIKWLNDEGKQEEADPQILLSAYLLDMTQIPMTRISERNRQQALDLAIYQEERRLSLETFRPLMFDPSKVDAGTAALHDWLLVVTGDPTELAVPLAVMRHFIWQIKRKVLCKKVDWHLMPVIHGDQNTGKSTAIKALYAPIDSYVKKANSVAEITDSRQFKAMSKRYLCFFDEMGRSEEVNIEALKNIITSDKLTFKPLYTNINVDVRQNLTFIGATNRDIRSLIKDSTGMRRFYQINCAPHEKVVKYWPLLEKIDIQSIWQSVDENLDRPEIVDWLTELREHQEDIRTKTSLEEFIEDRSLEPGELAIPIKDIYVHYAVYCRNNGYKALSKNNMAVEMTHMGYEKGRANWGRYLKLNQSLDIKDLPSTDRIKVIND